jgi:hypothetical protein
MLASLSDSTYKQYDGCIKKWVSYCNNKSLDYTNPSVLQIVDFLTEVFDNGAQYGTINSYKSALSLILGEIVNHEIIKRFMKGVFKLRPSKPRYNVTWDPNIVLNYLSHKWPNETLSLEILGRKSLTLLALVTAHRVQTLSLIKLSNIKVNAPVDITIHIPDSIKTTKPNSYQPILRLPYFDTRPEICPARCLEVYINKTATLRKEHDYLFISHRRPHNKLSPQTLCHWIKNTLCFSGIDTSIFSAHSTRHAATTSANKLEVSLDLIRKTAGWTNSSSVFAKYYNKEIIVDPNQFAMSVLSSNNL